MILPIVKYGHPVLHAPARPVDAVTPEIAALIDNMFETMYAAPGIGLVRPTNRAGGLEGGVTNGEDIRVSGYMKPISTLMKPLRSVDLATGEESPAAIERSDVCAISAAAVVAEAGLAWVLASAMREKFGGDTMRDLTASLEAYRARLSRRLPARRA